MTECVCCGDDFDGEALESKHGPVCSAACLRWLAENDDEDTEREPEQDRTAAMTRAIAMVRDGSSYGDAAKACRVAGSTLFKACRKAGVTSKNPRHRPLSEPMARAVAMIRDGASMSAAAKACGVDRESMRQYCRRHNIGARTEAKAG